jgi:hypothetical protein
MGARSTVAVPESRSQSKKSLQSGPSRSSVKLRRESDGGDSGDEEPSIGDSGSSCSLASSDEGEKSGHSSESSSVEEESDEGRQVAIWGSAWAPDEDGVLGAGLRAGKRWQEIADELPGRTARAVQNRGQALGLKHPSVIWRPDEDAILRNDAKAGASWESISDRLPNRAIRACKERVRLMKTSWGLRRLQVPGCDGRTPSPRRPWTGVSHRKGHLKTGERRTKKRWTEAENSVLREGMASGKWRFQPSLRENCRFMGENH